MSGRSHSSASSYCSVLRRHALLAVLLVCTLLSAEKAFAISGTTLWCLPDGWEREKSEDKSVFAHIVHRKNGKALGVIDASFRPLPEGYSSVGTALESFFSGWRWDVLNTGEDVVFSGVAAYDGKKAKFEFFLYTEGTFEEGFFVHAKKILVNGREIQIHFEDVLAQIYLK